jgi:hypothetical protein
LCDTWSIPVVLNWRFCHSQFYQQEFFPNSLSNGLLDSDKRTVYDIDWAVYESIDLNYHASVRVKFTTANERTDQLSQIHIRIHEPNEKWLPTSNIYLNDVLETLGEPADIRVLVIPPLFRWTLLYPKEGLVMQYYFYFGLERSRWEIDENEQTTPIEMCPYLEMAHSIEVWIMNNEIADFGEVEISQPEPNDWPLKDITGNNVSISTFTKTFTDSSEKRQNCLQILSYKELVEQKYPFR